MSRSLTYRPNQTGRLGLPSGSRSDNLPREDPLRRLGSNLEYSRSRLGPLKLRRQQRSFHRRTLNNRGYSGSLADWWNLQHRDVQRRRLLKEDRLRPLPSQRGSRRIRSLLHGLRSPPHVGELNRFRPPSSGP
jgi:hypothetical protein